MSLDIYTIVSACVHCLSFPEWVRLGNPTSATDRLSPPSGEVPCLPVVPVPVINANIRTSLIFFFFEKINFIYLFIFGCVGSSLLCTGFL